jgi:hypothetical protein
MSHALISEIVREVFCRSEFKSAKESDCFDRRSPASPLHELTLTI